MTSEENHAKKLYIKIVLSTILVFSSGIVPVLGTDSFAQEQGNGDDKKAPRDLGIRPVFDNGEVQPLSSDPSSGQPWVAAYHDPVPDHFAAYKTKITCNFGGTDRTKIQADNFLACAQSLQSPTSVTGLDYGVQASVTLQRTGDMIVSADVWRACESQPGVGCSPSGSITKVSSQTATISATLSSDIMLFMEWSSTGSTLTWYYQINSGSKTQYHTWTKPTSEAHPRFNTGVCFISWPDCSEFFILRTARYFQAGVGSDYPIGQSGWFVTIKNPAFATSATGSYNPFFSPARVIHGDDALTMISSGEEFNTQGSTQITILQFHQFQRVK